MPAISRMIVPAGPKCHRKLCSTGVSQDHMPCLQSHQALQATCAFGQPAPLIIPGSYTFQVLISKQKGGPLHYVLLCMQQLACTAYFQERKGNIDMAETAKQHTTMIRYRAQISVPRRQNHGRAGGIAELSVRPLPDLQRNLAGFGRTDHLAEPVRNPCRKPEAEIPAFGQGEMTLIPCFVA